LTGRYSGSLKEVLGRILDGNDYIVEVSEDAVRIVVLAPAASARAAVVPASAPTDVQRAPAAVPPQPVATPAPTPSVQPVARTPSVPSLASYLTMSSIAGSESAP
jgi:hypothetical protein